MPSPQTLLMFAAASLALAVIPGPTMLLALSNGMGGGMRRAVWGMAGAILGSALVIAVVAVGLGSLLAASATLFEALRAVGVLYLLWLAAQLWRSPPLDVRDALAHVPGRQAQGRAAFVRSLLVALSNPKSLLFFADENDGQSGFDAGGGQSGQGGPAFFKNAGGGGFAINQDHGGK